MTTTTTESAATATVTHELKIWPTFYASVVSGDKPYEIRKNDRDYHVGDILFLREWAPEHEEPCVWTGYEACNLCGRLRTEPARGRYTGRATRVRVTHLTPAGEWGLPADVCVLGVSRPMDLERVEVGHFPAVLYNLALQQKQAMAFRAGLYRHYAGGLYVAHRIVTHHETRLPMVEYTSLTTGHTNVRPLIGWAGDADAWWDVVQKNDHDAVSRFEFAGLLGSDIANAALTEFHGRAMP